MEIDRFYVLKLSQKEAEALKILLGKYSNETKKQAGLNEEEMELTSIIYYALPDKYDKEET